MARKSTQQEPLLNSVARKLGQAAGTLANMAHTLTNDLRPKESQPPPKPGSRRPRSVKKATSIARQSRATKQRVARPARESRVASSPAASPGKRSTAKSAARKKPSRPA
jgi:hypothetical protein